MGGWVGRFKKRDRHSDQHRLWWKGREVELEAQLLANNIALRLDLKSKHPLFLPFWKSRYKFNLPSFLVSYACAFPLC